MVFERLRRRGREESLEETSLPQGIYFHLMAEVIEECEGDLYLVGVDEDFWRNDRIISAVLRPLSRGRNLHAVISSHKDAYKPEWFYEHPSVDVTETDRIFEDGFLIMGKSGVLVWSNKHSTHHPVEKHKKIPFRGRVEPKKSPEYLKTFDKIKSGKGPYDLPEPVGDLEALKKAMEGSPLFKKKM